MKKLEIGKEKKVGKIEYRMTEKSTAVVEFYFTPYMVTQHGWLKGMLRVYDRNLVLHGRRVMMSPYRDPKAISQSMNLECLISTTENTIFNPELLIMNFLEKMIPVEHPLVN